jgi:hypothetical protein
LAKADFKEECWLLYGIRLEKLFPGKKYFIGFQKYHTLGTAARVEMDYDTANSPWVIGWYHTHPGIKHVTPSATDNSTMRSWVKSIYKTYLCGIRCGNYSACYCYYVGGLRKDKSTIVKKSNVYIRFFGSFFFGEMIGG